MKLHVIGTGSKGNAYLLTNGREALLLECGVNIQDIKKALEFDLRPVVACLLTHEHGDHSCSINQVLGLGIPVWSSFGTHQALRTESHHRARFLHADHTQHVGGSFKVKAYPIRHDCAEPFCFLIHHPDCGTVLFMTDTEFSEYKFRELNQIIIEANHDIKILDERIAAGESAAVVRDRVIQSHMSLETCKQTLKSYDLSRVENVVLIHMSSKNSDKTRFRAEIQQATGKMVHVAENGKIIDFNLKPY